MRSNDVKTSKLYLERKEKMIITLKEAIDKKQLKISEQKFESILESFSDQLLACSDDSFDFGS